MEISEQMTEIRFYFEASSSSPLHLSPIMKVWAESRSNSAAGGYERKQLGDDEQQAEFAGRRIQF
jgi:hypothetical protein